MSVLVWLAILAAFAAGLFIVGMGINMWRFNKGDAVGAFIVAIPLFGLSYALSVEGAFSTPEHVPIAPIQGPPAPKGATP